MNSTFILGFLLLVILLLAPTTPSLALPSEPDPDPPDTDNIKIHESDKRWWNVGGETGVVGGPGGHPKGGFVTRTVVVCMDEGPCYNKKLTCPAKCFTSYSRSGNGFGAGGGCTTLDCDENCTYH